MNQPLSIENEIQMAVSNHLNLLKSYKTKISLSFNKIPIPLVEYIVGFLDEHEEIKKQIVKTNIVMVYTTFSVLSKSLLKITNSLLNLPRHEYQLRQEYQLQLYQQLQQVEQFRQKIKDIQPFLNNDEMCRLNQQIECLNYIQTLINRLQF
jgi:hypothetical protein